MTLLLIFQQHLWYSKQCKCNDSYSSSPVALDSVLIVRDSSCSQVMSISTQEKKGVRPLIPTLQTCKIWAVWCLSSWWYGCWCVKRVPSHLTSLVNMRCSIYNQSLLPHQLWICGSAQESLFNPSNSFSAPNPFLIQLAVWLTGSQALRRRILSAYFGGPLFLI